MVAHTGRGGGISAPDVSTFFVPNMTLVFCFEHILLNKQKDQKQVLTTNKFLSLNVTIVVMHMNIEQKNIILIYTKKYYLNLKDSSINFCTEAKMLLLICKGRLLLPYKSKSVSILT